MMRLLIISISLILAHHTVRPQKSSLQKATDELSILARLVSGISIHNGLTSKTQTFEDVVAELMGFESGNSVQKLLAFSVDQQQLSSNLDALISSLSQLAPNPMSNTDAVRKVLAELESMKGKIPDIEKGITSGLENDFKTKYQNLIDSQINEEYLTFTEIKQFSERMESILNIENDMTNKQLIYKILEKMQEIYKSKDTLTRELETLKKNDHTNELQNLYSLIDEYKDLDPVYTIYTVAVGYQKLFGQFKQLPTKLTAFNSEGDVLLPIANKHNDFMIIKDAMNEISTLVKALEVSGVSSRIEGFPEGVSSMGRMFEDLKSDWLKTNVASGKDVEKLTKALAPMKEFYEKMKGVESELASYTRNQDLSAAIERVSSLFQNLWEEGEKLANVQSLTNSINQLSTVIEDLKPLTNTIDEDFKTDFETVKAICNFAEEVKNAFEMIAKAIPTSELQGFINGVFKIIEPKASATEVEPEEMTELIKKINSLPQKTKFIVQIGQLATLSKPLLFSKLPNASSKKIKWESVKNVQEVLKGTELVEVLKKLKSVQYDADGVEKLVGFGANVRQVQNGQLDFESVEKAVSSLAELKESMNNAKAVADKLGPTRVRRASDIDILQKLGKAPDLARDVGRGVKGLQKLSDVEKKKNQLVAVADSPTEVNDQIAAVQGMASVWTQGNRNGIKNLVEGVEKLEKNAKKADGENGFKELSTVLAEAARIPGVAIDAKLFKDPISLSLQTSANSAANNAAPTFAELSDLTLDFASYSPDLKTASYSLDPIQSFFDEMFGTRRSDSRSDSDDPILDKGVPVMYILIGGGVVMLIAVIATILFVIVRAKSNQKKQQKQLDDPETYKLLLFSKYNSLDNMVDFMSLKARHFLLNDNYNDFKLHVTGGAWIDARTQGCDIATTLLHDSVRTDRPKYTEMLIRHGADRTLMDGNYETAVDMAVRMKSKRCLAIFKKYEKKKFSKVLPHVITRDSYAVSSQFSVKSNKYWSKFSHKFGKYLTSDIYGVTHHIVEVDKHGAYHLEDGHLWRIFDPCMMMKADWVKACVENPSKFENNFEYRVMKIRYKHLEFDTLARIKDFIHRSKVPFLFNAYMTFEKNNSWRDLRSVCKRLGAHGTDSKEFPMENHKEGHLYYQEHMGRHIVLYESQDEKNVLQWRAQWGSDKRFNFMSKDEFIEFLLNFEFRCAKVEIEPSVMDSAMGGMTKRASASSISKASASRASKNQSMSRNVSANTSADSTISKSPANRN